VVRAVGGNVGKKRHFCTHSLEVVDGERNLRKEGGREGDKGGWVG